MKRWEVFHREKEEDATLLVIGVDDLPVGSLSTTKDIAFYVSNAFRFKKNSVRTILMREPKVTARRKRIPLIRARRTIQTHQY